MVGEMEWNWWSQLPIWQGKQEHTELSFPRPLGREQIRTDLALTIQKTHTFSLTGSGHLGKLPHLKRQKWGGQGIRCGGQKEQRCMSRKAPGMFKDSEPSAVWGPECWRLVRPLPGGKHRRPRTDPNSSHSSRRSLMAWDLFKVCPFRVTHEGC